MGIGVDIVPSIVVGPIVFNSNEGQVVTGDAFYISPKSTSKVVAGSGGFNTGQWIVTNNGVSTSSGIDPDAVDSNVSGA